MIVKEQKPCHLGVVDASRVVRSRKIFVVDCDLTYPKAPMLSQLLASRPIA